jgi:hypothetical protein
VLTLAKEEEYCQPGVDARLSGLLRRLIKRLIMLVKPRIGSTRHHHHRWRCSHIENAQIRCTSCDEKCRYAQTIATAVAAGPRSKVTSQLLLDAHIQRARVALSIAVLISQ